MARTFTKPYVDALFQLVGTPDEAERLLPGLEAFGAILEGNDELAAILKNPGLDRGHKMAIVQQIAKKLNVEPIAERLLTILLGNRRLTSLGAITVAIRERLDRERRIVEATVTSAAPLDAATENQIQKTLESRSRMNVRIRAVVDPALLGGFVVQLGSEIYDATLASRLERTRLALHTGNGAAN